MEKLKKETDQATFKELAQSIYRDYLSAESPKEVGKIKCVLCIFNSKCLEVREKFMSDFVQVIFLKNEKFADLRLLKTMNFLLDLGTFLIGLIGHSSSLGVRGTINVEEDVDFTVRW